jgi:hypothetical protein
MTDQDRSEKLGRFRIIGRKHYEYHERLISTQQFERRIHTMASVKTRCRQHCINKIRIEPILFSIDAECNAWIIRNRLN